jgi:phage terminase small subunit
VTPEFRPPAGLRAATKRWYLDVSRDWQLEPHHLRLLALAAQSWDEAQSAAELVRRDGLLVTMPSGAQRPHPAVRIGSEAKSLFAKLIRELDLDLEPPAEARRPPALRSIAGGRS